MTDSELDLSSEDPVSLPGPHVTPAREKTRSTLAVTMIVILVIVIVFMGVLFLFKDLSRVKEFSSLIFTPVVTLLGPILGFYFGSETKK